MSDIAAASSHKLKVFISYSRRDLDFADQLAAILEWQGITVSLDRKGIHGSEKWQERLGQLILEADTIVFVLSPDSAGSPVCAWEVEEAARRNKRIVPVVSRPLEGKQPHAMLRDLNYIYFCAEKDSPGSGFGTGQVKLLEALKTDIRWLREHTRLEEIAARWDEKDRAADRLVRGTELKAFQDWRDRRPANAPDLTPLQRAFIGASEAEEVARESEERKHIEDIAVAQIEKQKALDDKQAALEREAEAQQARARVRRILQWGGGLTALAAVAAALSFAAYQSRNLAIQTRLATEAQIAGQEAERQKKVADAQKEVAERETQKADKFVRLVNSDPAGKRAMDKTCLEAIAVTSTLATTTDHAAYQQYNLRFWELYYTSMYIVELDQRKKSGHDVSSIETNMVGFGRKLRGLELSGEPLPHKDLCAYAGGVRDGCVNHLDVPAAVPCQ